jgi:hypothetical protein
MTSRLKMARRLRLIESGGIDLAKLHARTANTRWMVKSIGLVVLALLAHDAHANTLVHCKESPVNGPSGLVAFVLASGTANQIAIAQKDHKKLTEDEALTNYYSLLVSNPAVSGIAISVSWDTLNHTHGGYDWAFLKNAFEVVSAWNLTHTPKKFVQVLVSAGFNSPPWIFDHIKGGSCDGLFESPAPKHKPKPSCGYTNIFVATESGTPTPKKLPMPWDSDYQDLWKSFQTDLKSFIDKGVYRSGGKSVPYTDAFASISVAGPTASSTEIILPHDPTTIRTLPKDATVAGITDLVAWDDLLKNHYGASSSYVDSDQAFVEAWKTAIDMFGRVFSGTTLIVATGAGLPNFPAGVASTPPAGFGSANCHPKPSMDCAAEATIVAYFSQQTSGGFNAKAVAQDGQESDRRDAFPLSELSIKWLTANTSGGLTELTGSTTVLSHMYGGLQFSGAVSIPNSKEGCSIGANAVSAGKCTPEQSMFDVLQLIFRGTPVAGKYGESTSNADPAFKDAPLNFLQVYAKDFLYAADMDDCSDAELMTGKCVAKKKKPVSIEEVDDHGVKSTMLTTLQKLLDNANRDLLSIAEPPEVCVPTPGGGSVVRGSSGGGTPGVPIVKKRNAQ